MSAAGLLFCGACTAPPEQPARASTAPVPAELHRRCQQEAEKRFQQIPAVSSGRTTYLLTGDKAQFYQECVAREQRPAGQRRR